MIKYDEEILKDISRNPNYNQALELLQRWDRQVIQNGINSNESLLDTIFDVLYKGIIL